jgi:sugar phosphate isomerase/epimerase
MKGVSVVPRLTFRLAFLPANQAWVLTWGLSLIDLDGRRLFDSRGEILKALGEHGLRVTTSGEVLPVEPAEPEPERIGR